MIMAPMATRPATATDPEKVEAAPVNGAAVGVIGTVALLTGETDPVVVGALGRALTELDATGTTVAVGLAVGTVTVTVTVDGAGQTELLVEEEV